MNDPNQRHRGLTGDVLPCPCCDRDVGVYAQAHLKVLETRWNDELFASMTISGTGQEPPPVRPSKSVPADIVTRHARATKSRERLRHSVEPPASFWAIPFWACDDCIATARALAGQPWKQSVGLSGWFYFAFVDVSYPCTECAGKVVFRASEQLHWYEELGFWCESYPKRCVECRANRRTQKRLQKQLMTLLATLDATNVDQLLTIAAVYEDMGNAAKAKEFRSRARNR